MMDRPGVDMITCICNERRSEASICDVTEGNHVGLKKENDG